MQAVGVAGFVFPLAGLECRSVFKNHRRGFVHAGVDRLKPRWGLVGVVDEVGAGR